jgi:hypothetical protein
MTFKKAKLALGTLSSLAILAAGGAQAATITGWNTDNVVVAPTPADGITGASVVYDRDPNAPGAVTNGRIAFTPPEAVSPGIKVQPETYTQGGPSGLTLDGCLMTSNPTATCTSPFQSGKRIKTQVTDNGPIDLVFDLEQGAEANYQVFYRLINQTSKSLAGFALELGFGVGSEFVKATAADGISFSTEFRAQPASSMASATTQFPFGLFGDALTNPNFTLDGFFAPERTGLNVVLDPNDPFSITSAGYFGPYTSLFSNWLSQDAVPLGAFWDNDNDASTDALLMAWYTNGQWEMRRDVLDAGAGTAISLSGADVEYFDNFADLVARLGIGSSLFEDDIEDLANLNVNYAINLGAGVKASNFTLRTTVTVAPVPVPMSATMLVGAIGALGFAARRRRRTA